ncbi:SPOR domain-containing protein [Marinicella sp. W31]|uniref:SPOR domain-containing protein n=1 Tax=Marinicella sp. W31 TaxID=3023713 RepID=UPI003758039F
MMRTIFILLLFANLSFFIWHNRFAEKPVQHEFLAVDPGVPKLALLEEVAPKNNENWQQQQPDAEETAIASINQLCFSVGPFATEADLQPVVDQLTPLVLKTRIRKMTTTQEAGYWVYLPALDSRQDALRAGRALAAANVRDYYVVTTGDRENTVSLGLYRQPFNADNRIAELQSKGFDVKKEIRLEQWPEFWLDYSSTEEQLASIPNVTLNNPDLQQNNVSCEK